MANDIGDAAIEQALNTSAAVTNVNIGNPADVAGIISTIEIWLVSVGCSASAKVGSFYVVSGSTLKCRDSQVIGALAPGAKRTVSGLSIAVEIGDYIGFYDSAGRVARALSGGGEASGGGTGIISLLAIKGITPFTLTIL